MLLEGTEFSYIEALFFGKGRERIRKISNFHHAYKLKITSLPTLPPELEVLLKFKLLYGNDRHLFSTSVLKYWYSGY